MADMSDPAHRRTLIVGIVVALFLVASVAIAATRGSGEPAGNAVQESGSESDSAGVSAQAPASGSSGTKPGSGKPKPGSDKTTATTSQVGSSASAPAPKGSKLTTISAAPQQTLGMIVLPEGVEQARYDVTFRPYGWSPAGPDAGRLVARIMTATGTDKGAEAVGKDFADRNATFTCSPAVVSALDAGGRYSGVMEIRQRGDVGVLYLLDVKVAD